MGDYPTIIKRPMDLGTVRKRLDNGEYMSVQQVAEDVDLTFKNAMTYNVDDSWIYQAARTLKNAADKKFAQLIGASHSGSNDPTEVTFDMRLQLVQNTNQLHSKDLYGMVGIVEESCGKAVDSSNPSEVEIDIDSLDLPTFLKVDKYVRERLQASQ